ncbi:MAG: long-chain fatty acid--CoA ligase [Verrucomicrobiales bacterium]|nr:long-chain fatty acid--CoA ligase [Verrucomicrobiales bacterium]
MSLHSEFIQVARRAPERTAVFHGPDEFSYGHYAGVSARVAGALVQRFGIQPGDRVGIWLKNCPEFVSALFGILRAGAVAVPVNNFLKAEEVAYVLADAQIDLLISDQGMQGALEVLQRGRPSLKCFLIGEFASLPARADALADAACGPDDLAVLIYTSGTTGHPKGAMLTHGNLQHNVASCRVALEIGEDDRITVLLPMFHSFMMTVGILLPLTSGSGLVLIKSLHPPKNILAEIIQHRATVLPAIPQLFRALASAPPPAGLALRVCVSGAAPLPVEILKSFSARYPVPLVEGYGLSEASPVVTLNPLRGVQKPGSIGLPIPEVAVSLRNDAGEAVAPGETGEVCVRGGNVMRGYWNQPDATAAAIRDGWLYTGDMARQDADGYFFITDRKKDMLLVNGINVYPREIEEVLHRYPGVKEVAVIGRADSRKGEQPVAYLALDDGLTLDAAAVRRFLKEHLADYKVPRDLRVLPALPRNATGKILKTALRELERNAAGART